MENMVSFWKNKKVYITGHTGFKGAWLSFILKELGAVVKGYALKPSSSPNLYNILSIEKHINSEIGDIRNEEQLEKSISDFSPEIVFHMAAQPLVRLSYKLPKETYETNVMGTLNVLEALKNITTLKSLVIITTDKCYLNNEEEKPFIEEDPLGGYDIYSSSKACTEILTESWKRSFLSDCRFGLATARAGNIIGGGDWCEDRIIPDIIRAFSQNQKLVVRNPESTRPWQHVFDALKGYMLLAENLYKEPKKYSQAWNFGPTSENPKKVIDVVKLSSMLWDNKEYISTFNEISLNEAKTLQLDSSKAKNILHWAPKLKFEDAIGDTINWYKIFYQNVSSINYYSKNQVITYFR
tara:strand:- start:5338 stop:6396 length:1059 start_codon:yes stop_codon:yes gene_type:complete